MSVETVHMPKYSGKPSAGALSVKRFDKQLPVKALPRLSWFSVVFYCQRSPERQLLASKTKTDALR
jgi:hypothetical protein